MYYSVVKKSFFKYWCLLLKKKGFDIIFSCPFVDVLKKAESDIVPLTHRIISIYQNTEHGGCSL